MRAQHRQSPRGANGDRAKPLKGKEKKEAKPKDDKVNDNVPSRAQIGTERFFVTPLHNTHIILLVVGVVYLFIVNSRKYKGSIL